MEPCFSPISPPMSRVGDGASIGLGCQSCAFLGDCGGVFDDYDCLGGCCGDPEHCMRACPRSPDFVTIVRDCGGLESSGKWKIKQDGSFILPSYIPMIQHGYARGGCLEWPFVAVPTLEIAKGSGENGLRFADGFEMRRRLHLGPSTKVILVSVAKDTKLERYWKRALIERFPEYLAHLGVSLITAPNFSFPRNAPRTEPLVNRRRSLICAEEFSESGMDVVPHLNATTKCDWEFWFSFLREHDCIRFVAKEFQTGCSRKKTAAWHIGQLRDLEQKLGRGLHLIAVGGRRHVELLAKLSGLTVVDSVPFIKSMKRRRIERNSGRWHLKRTPSTTPLDDLLFHNVRLYDSAVAGRLTDLRQSGLPFLEGAFPFPGSRENAEAARYPFPLEQPFLSGLEIAAQHT